MYMKSFAIKKIQIGRILAQKPQYRNKLSKLFQTLHTE